MGTRWQSGLHHPVSVYAKQVTLHIPPSPLAVASVEPPRPGIPVDPSVEAPLETDMGTRWQSGLHHPVSVYAKQVTQGKLREMCGPFEIMACQRHLDDLRRQGTDDFPYASMEQSPASISLSRSSSRASPSIRLRSWFQ